MENPESLTEQGLMEQMQCNNVFCILTAEPGSRYCGSHSRVFDVPGHSEGDALMELFEQYEKDNLGNV